MNHQYRLKWRNKNSIKWNTESTVYTSLESINVHIESCKKNVPEMEYFIEHREVSNWEAITNVPNDDNSKVKELLDLISKGNCCHKEYCHYAKATDIVLKECGEDMNENTISRACHRIKSDTSKGFCEDYNFGICKTALKGEFSTDLNIHSISGGDDGIYKVSCDYWNCDKSFKIYDNTIICIREIDEKNGCLKFLV